MSYIDIGDKISKDTNNFSDQCETRFIHLRVKKAVKGNKGSRLNRVLSFLLLALFPTK